MATRLPIADDIIAVVQILITDLGTDAFKTDGRVQLYSGPQRVISAALGFVSNRERSFKQAARLLTTMIDHTNVGQFLEKYEDDQDVYSFFAKHYGALTPRAIEEADKVMRFASREFIRASFGRVATAVCGAAVNRVFFEIELPELVANTRIDEINDIDMGRVRGIYKSKGAYEAYRKICQAEVAMAYRHAKGENTADAWQDYAERRQQFMMEGKVAMAAGASALKTTTAKITAIHASLATGAAPAAPAAIYGAKNAAGARLH